MSEQDPLVATPSQTVGPYLHIGLGEPRAGRADTRGLEPVRIAVRVLDGDGKPLDDALVEFWTAAGTCGRAPTDADGRCVIDTARPAGRHVNVCLFARGLLRHVFTRIYFEGDAAVASDPALALVPADRRQTLMARREPGGTGWTFDIHLQGANETVFFDQ